MSLHRLHDRVEELGRRAAVSRPQTSSSRDSPNSSASALKDSTSDAVGEHHERVLTFSDVGGRAIQLLEEAEYMTGRLKALDRAVAG